MNSIECTIELTISALKEKLHEIIEMEGVNSKAALCVRERLDYIIAEKQKYLLEKNKN